MLTVQGQDTVCMAFIACNEDFRKALYLYDVHSTGSTRSAVYSCSKIYTNFNGFIIKITNKY